ncbi:MAG: SDR family NAD(P)-dependent oxidoreductase, partial [Rhodobacteraceae bacterium]|nr:SDR family NAD(P)-dependent oxidoreductase [Paracoccaceae bacterium]
MAQDRGLVVITGASRGIGRALARRFEEAGHPVLAVARTPAGGEGAVAADLARRDGVAAVVA